MVLELREVGKRFKPRSFMRRQPPPRPAVASLSLQLGEGETLAIVGESGSGKSTTARLAMRLLEADHGRILWNDVDVTEMSPRALRPLRRHIQMVFQDPYASLNPRMRIGESVGEGLRVHAPELSRRQRRDRVAEMLDLCGLDASVMDRYPHQFSGGQRQRIGIARSLIVEPKVLVLDEPVSALDVSVQAQILNLLQQIQQDRGLAYLFISHDLSVVQHVADRVLVMFAGHVVEEGDIEAIFAHPRHPYTKALLDARPILHPAERRDRQVEGEAPAEDIAATGCPYRQRCERASDACASFDGALREMEGISVACLHPR
ncbi:MAG: ATP-binding cassette domain-containing protein [Gammaproteobacteria bacterium]|nr:MAG: ATP-binding cassette domain-containing protein [Gammaproteobacteria bacterium]